MENIDKRFVAEEVRLIHKELGWVVKNLAKLYAAIRTEENEPLSHDDDPNQLELFENA